MEEADTYAKIIWDYMLMHQKLEKADAIVVFGSRDMGPAYRACELYFQGYAPVVVFSGNHGIAHTLPEPEAQMYAKIARERGIPEKVMFIEDKSLNSGQNIAFTRTMMLENNLPCQRLIVIHKPYMERRVYAAFKKQWPEPEIMITSEEISFEAYLQKNHDTKERIISLMVGDVLRLREYPKLGFQIEQDILNEVWEAGQKLLEMGYDKYKI